MAKHLRYLRYVLRHKWRVLFMGLKFGIPIRALLHDISKFRPDEWFAYANYFYGNKDFAGFIRAHMKHVNRNDHHWQYWVHIWDNDEFTHSIPLNVMKEMLCDWWAMGDGTWVSVSKWYEENQFKIRMAGRSREYIEKNLRYLAAGGKPQWRKQ